MTPSTRWHSVSVFVLLIAFCALAVLSLNAQVVSAQSVIQLPETVVTASPTGCAGGAGGFVPLECFQDSRRLRDVYQTEQLGPFIQKLFVGAIALGAVLAVLRLAWAGFVYMGTDMWGQKEHAKEIIRDTLLGLFLLLAIWIILNQINPEMLNLKINATNYNPGLQGGPSGVY